MQLARVGGMVVLFVCVVGVCIAGILFFPDAEVETGTETSSYEDLSRQVSALAHDAMAQSGESEPKLKHTATGKKKISLGIEDGTKEGETETRKEWGMKAEMTKEAAKEGGRRNEGDGEKKGKTEIERPKEDKKVLNKEAKEDANNKAAANQGMQNAAQVDKSKKSKKVPEGEGKGKPVKQKSVGKLEAIEEKPPTLRGKGEDGTAVSKLEEVESVGKAEDTHDGAVNKPASDSNDKARLPAFLAGTAGLDTKEKSEPDGGSPVATASAALPDASAGLTVTALDSGQCANKCSDTVCANIRRSSLYSKCCESKGLLPMPAGTIPLIVSATPRSGTVATFTLLSRLGLKVHNDWGNPSADGIVSWIHIFSEFDVLADPKNTKSFKYFGPGKLSGRRFDVAFHLVRDPLSSITSLGCTEPVNSDQWSAYVKRHVNIKQQFWSQKNKLGIGMQMWLEWHRFLDSVCVDRFRLEDLFDPSKTERVLSHMFKKLGRKPPGKERIKKALEKTGSKTNQRKHREKVTWKELMMVDPDLTRQVYALAESYGYTFQDDLDKIEKNLGKVTQYPGCNRMHNKGRVTQEDKKEPTPLRRRRMHRLRTLLSVEAT
mmetsp:Transcript_54592/g.111417  ORF Transcript_54592/g.111417 Transcript_54592/m.111417 type:complete len:603 (+) Transcript_54592:54-1862(+)